MKYSFIFLVLKLSMCKELSIRIKEKYIYLILLFFSISLQANAKTLALTEIKEGIPEAGKRVIVYLSEYSKAYYILFLPYNFNNATKTPVIFESPGNGNSLDSTCLGYGISAGMNYIWVSVPFVDSKGIILNAYWGDHPCTTVNFWLAVLNDLNTKFNIDNDKIILCGFSRGAISTSYIGNYNDEISSKWTAYFAHAHFDGCCQNLLGNVEERINRIKNKKVLISVGENDYAKTCSIGAYKKLLKKAYHVTYIEVPDLDHNTSWILEDCEATKKAQNWLKNLFINN